MKLILTILILSIGINITSAQVSFLKRLEIDLKEDDFRNHELFEFGENGFIIKASGKNTMKGREMRYSIYNNELNFVKDITELLSVKKSSRHESVNTQSKIVECVYEMKGSLEVLIINSNGSASKKLNINAPKGMKTMSVVSTENYAVVLLGSTKAIYIMGINLESGQSNTKEIKIKDFKATQIRFNTISTMDNSDEVIVAYEVKATSKQQGPDKKVFQDYLVSYNCENGNFEVLNVAHKDAKNILSISAAKLNHTSYVITGSFTTKSGSGTANAAAEGVFFAKIENGNVVQYTDKSYNDFDEFLKHLPERIQNRIEKKKNRKESRGKELKFFSYTVFHGLIVTENGYYSLGEHYHPTYRTETRRDANGNVTTVTYFDGYQYTHATVVNFDQNGNFVWDRSFKMYPAIKPFYVKRFISTNYQSDVLNMIFSDGYFITSKSIRSDGAIGNDRTSEKIDTGIDGDRTRMSYSEIIRWYENYFLAYGFSTIKNKESDDAKRKRRVFFVSKVKFE